MKKLLLFFISILIFNLFSQDPQQLAKNWYETYIKNLNIDQKRTFLNYINAMIDFTKDQSNSNQFKLNKIKNIDLKGFDKAINDLWGKTAWLQADYAKANTILPVFKTQLETSLR